MNFLSAPRQPFIGLAAVAATGIVLADYFPNSSAIVVSLLTVGAVIILIWPRSIFTYAFVGAGFFWIHSFDQTDSPGRSLGAAFGSIPRAITVNGAVVSEPRIAANGLATFLLRLDSIKIEGKPHQTHAIVLARWRGHPEFGDQVLLFGIVDFVAGPRNPGEFDMRAYLARRDVRYSLLVRYPENGKIIRHGGGNPILVAAQQSRKWMQQALCRGLDDAPDVQNFISGIALGLRHQAPEDIEEPFQQTGTLHLFAVAGLHVGIVAQLLWMLASVAQVSRRWAAAIIIPLVLFYSAVTGLHVSSVRAAIMCSILLGGLFLERRVLAFNTLAAAAFFLLCCDTNEIFSTGFQLSFSVVAGILLFADPLFRAMWRLSRPDTFFPRNLLSAPRRALNNCYRWVCRGSSVSIAAWIGSLPLIWWYFYLVTPISLFANLVVVPLAFFVLAIGLLSILSTPLSLSLAIAFNNANWALAKLVLAIVHVFAQLPGGHYYFSHFHQEDPTIAKLAVLDVGTGAAAHATSNRVDWLFDCGSERDYERILRSYLHCAGVNHLSGLLLSHGDSLHIGGARRLLDDLPPAILIDNPSVTRSVVHRRLREDFQRRGINAITPEYRYLDASRNLSLRVFQIPFAADAPTADDRTLVVQLAVANSTKVLFVFDSGLETENALINSGSDLRSDILVKGQHHSGESGSDVFLEAVQPELIIATSRDFPAHERISDKWSARVHDRGIRLFRQDETGAVEVKFTPRGWEARSYMTGETFRSSTR